jgi:ribose 5-phosphate isomerase B
MNIAIGGDHAAVELKEAIILKLESFGHIIKNFGTNSADSVDYPDFGHPVAKAVIASEADLGIVICGSGNGINMTVNKYPGIRSALAWEVELATLAKQHNNANVLALPARFISMEKGLAITEAFINTNFEGGRHQRRVEKISRP